MARVVLRFVKADVIDRLFELNTHLIFSHKVYTSYVQKSQLLEDGCTCLLTSVLNLSSLPKNIACFFVCFRCELRIATFTKRTYCFSHRCKDECESTNEWEKSNPFSPMGDIAKDYCVSFDSLDFSPTGQLGFCVTKIFSKYKIDGCSANKENIESRNGEIVQLLGRLYYIDLKEISKKELSELKPFSPRFNGFQGICKGNDIGFILVQECSESNCVTRCKDLYF